jgi:hypothetical protein
LEFTLSEHQLSLLGFKKELPQTKTNRPSSRVSLLSKNIQRHNLIKQEEKKKVIESPCKTDRNSEPSTNKMGIMKTNMKSGNIKSNIKQNIQSGFGGPTAISG